MYRYTAYNRTGHTMKRTARRESVRKAGANVRMDAFKIRNCRCLRDGYCINTCGVCAYLLQIVRVVIFGRQLLSLFTDDYCNDSHFVLILMVIFITKLSVFCHTLNGITLVGFCKNYTYIKSNFW